MADFLKIADEGEVSRENAGLLLEKIGEILREEGVVDFGQGRFPAPETLEFEVEFERSEHETEFEIEFEWHPEEEEGEPELGETAHEEDLTGT